MATAMSTEKVFGQEWKPGFNEYVAVSVKTTRVIFKCGNKQCKHVWAREYKKCYKSMGGPVGTGYLMKYEAARLDLNRVDENGREISLGYDHECPKCKAHKTTSNAVVGTQTETKCDARCTSAKGHNCECSCGGKNHGIDHLA